MKTMTNDEFRMFVSKIVLPTGLTGSFEEDDFNRSELNYIIQSEDVKIIFRAAGHGSTSFKCPDGKWRTFDRRGVDWSFYSQSLWDGDDRELDPTKIVQEQVSKIAERLTYYAAAITVPGLEGSFTVSPEGLVELRTRIKQNGVVHFAPSGFGRGYTVTKRRTRQFGERRATQELESFLNSTPLFVVAVDCD